MKKIVVVSDSHGNNEALEHILKIEPDAFMYLHLGDSEQSSQSIFPFISIKGNNDYLIEEEHRIITIDNHKIYMTHGHKMYLSKDNLVSKARSNGCDIIMFGHTHRPYYELVDGITILNPGSLSYPRSAVGITYAIVKLQDNNVEVEIKQLD